MPMRKLKLNVDNLSVESFRTSAEGATRPGTVRAHSDVYYTVIIWWETDDCNPGIEPLGGAPIYA